MLHTFKAWSEIGETDNLPHSIQSVGLELLEDV